MIWQKLDSEYRGAGIYQFSLAPSARLDEGDIRKALFLSRRATVFTPATMHYEKGDQYWPMEPTPAPYWNIDEDYTFSLFKYKDAIAESGLIVLPQSVHYGLHSTPGIARDFDLVKTLSQTRVVNVEANPDLISAVLRRYRIGHQLVQLPQLYIPWVQGVSLMRILRIREDAEDEMAEFQRSYHFALQTYVENLRSLDFDRISHQIDSDVVTPALQSIDRKYRRILKQHRSIRLADATIAALPIVGVVITSSIIQDSLIKSVISTTGSALTGAIAGISMNRLQRRAAVDALEDEEFYLLWAIQKGSA
jgi:hypothetical protein